MTSHQVRSFAPVSEVKGIFKAFYMPLDDNPRFALRMSVVAYNSYWGLRFDVIDYLKVVH